MATRAMIINVCTALHILDPTPEACGPATFLHHEERNIAGLANHLDVRLLTKTPNTSTAPPMPPTYSVAPGLRDLVAQLAACVDGRLPTQHRRPGGDW